VNRIGDALSHPWLTVRVQIALGVLFIAASLPKIADPPSFAHMIYNYRIVPGSLVNLMALTMPWIELLCGVALVLGIWRRSATIVIAILLAVFITAISVNLVRGNPIDCGCFNVADAGKTIEQQFADMHWVVIRDLGMLVMVAQILWAGRRREIGGLEEAA